MNRLGRIALFVFLLLLGIEGGARALEWARPEVEDVAFGYAPYRMLRMTSAPFALNRDGFRAQEFDTYRGKFIVEFVGGSVCLGVGTNPGHPVSQQLEEALHRAGMKDASVVNLCQGGTTSAQELAILVQYGLVLHPQVVVSFNGANDLFHPRPLGDDPAPNLPYRNHEIQALFEGHHSLLEHLAIERVAGRLQRNWLAPVRWSNAAEKDVPSSSILRSYLYATESERALTEAQGGVFVLLLQPSLHYAKRWSQEEEAQWVSRRPQDARSATEYAHDLYAQARTWTSVWSARSGARFLDLTETFAHCNETIYTDSVHFVGNTGFRLVEAELEKQGLVDLIRKQYETWKQREPDQTGSFSWLR